MVVMFQPWFLCFFCFLPLLSSSQSTTSNNNQNVETFYPLADSPPAFNTPPSDSLPPPFQNTPPLTPSSQKSSSDNHTVAKAVGGTAAATLVIAGVFFFFLQKYAIAGRRRGRHEETITVSHPESADDGFKHFDGTLKGLIVDEKGLDVLYWRELQSGKFKTSFRKEVLDKPIGEEGKSFSFSKREKRIKDNLIQEIPLLRGKSSSSSAQIRPELDEIDQDIESSRPFTSRNSDKVAAVKSASIALPAVSAPPQAPSPPPPPAITTKKTPAPQAPSPPPPPAITTKKTPAPQAPSPPPPPAITTKKTPAPPPPPQPITVKKKPAPPPLPPPQVSSLSLSSKPPAAPKSKSSGSKGAESASGDIKSTAQTKLKPLHWDKVTANADHSMVWDKISGGSFRFDDDLMEALFGYVATNRKSPERNNNKSNLGSPGPGSPAQRFILDPRKSQNIAIVIRSLAISRQEILDALLDGHGFSADTLEKLERIAPTKEEETQILEYDGNPTKLADAESFLFHILKAVPSPFARINAMLFQLNYDSEILHLKESLQTLELGCKELRTRGLFLKLLEAVLKAGNRMNAGTARGNAQAFNLSALRKLSDVKSTDGKTTLLHFVVEEVVRSEGKRCVLNRNYSLGRNSSSRSNSSTSTASSDNTSREEREKEYMMLGLPVVGGLSVDFSNVKKAAAVDYDSFVNMCSALTARVNEIREFLENINDDRGAGFVREMKGFLESAEEELKVVKEEQTRVMELVKKTSEYYQAGASKDKSAHPLQLFVIIKDFLRMVDQACIEITRNQQKKKTAIKSGSSSPPSPWLRTPASFPNLPAHFMSDKSSSDSDESF